MEILFLANRAVVCWELAVLYAVGSSYTFRKTASTSKGVIVGYSEEQSKSKKGSHQRGIQPRYLSINMKARPVKIQGAHCEQPFLPMR